MKRYTHKRKWILILMDTIAVFLLSFDRTAYIYKYDGSHFGGIMVRISNFMVFFLTSAIVLGFNLYLSDLLKEYALIKINGESSGDNEYAQNKITMKKSSEFPGWDKWKEINKSGLECSVRLIRKGNKIIVITENLGITIEHTTVISDNPNVVYAALTGSRVALTDIRIR